MSTLRLFIISRSYIVTDHCFAFLEEMNWKMQFKLKSVVLIIQHNLFTALVYVVYILEHWQKLSEYYNSELSCFAPTVTELVVANRFMQTISAGNNWHIVWCNAVKSILECDESRNYDGDLEIMMKRNYRHKTGFKKRNATDWINLSMEGLF